MPKSANSDSLLNQFPKWIDREYIKQAICKSLGDDRIKILVYEIVPAIPKGENFASELFRIRIEYKNHGHVQHGSLIVKTRIENKEKQAICKALDSIDVFKHEMFLYQIVLPKIVNLLEIVGHTAQVAPTALKIDYDHGCIVFEDLCSRDYVMQSKRAGLDLSHAKLVLEKLAKFHAAGAKLNELEHGNLQHLDQGIFTKKSTGFDQFFVLQLENCARAVLSWPGFEQYGVKLLELTAKVIQYGRKMFEPKQDHFNTLVHGDMWTNNCMFKYSDKRPKDLIFIDFQFSCWTSPTIDLHYMFNTSLSYDVRFDHEEELVKFYYDILVASLKEMNYKGAIPSLMAFWMQYTEKSFYAITSTCVILPLILNEEEIDSDSLMEFNNHTQKAKERIYCQPKVQMFLKRLLPVFDRRGLLDIVE